MPQQSASNIPVMFHQGLVTSRDASTLSPGELGVATGCEYRIGSSHIYKQPGRHATAAVLGAAVVRLNYVQYDSGTDKLLAIAGGNVYESSPTTTPIFGSSVLSGLSSTAIPQFSSLQDRWVMCNSIDDVYIREPSNVPNTSTAWRKTVKTPSGQTTATHSTAAASGQKAASDSGSGYTNRSKAYDSDTATYALGTVNASTTSVTTTFRWSSNLATTGRSLYIMNAGGSDVTVTAGTTYKNWEEGTTTPPTRDSTYATHKIEVSQNFSAVTPTWTIVSNKLSLYTRTTLAVVVTDGVNLATDLAVRTTMTYSSGSGSAYGYIYDLEVRVGGSTARNIVNGLQYVVTERYTDSDGLVHESGPTQMSDKVAVGVNGVTVVTVTMPSLMNTFAQEFVIYRTLDTTDAGWPNLYEVGAVPTTSTTFADLLQDNITLATDKQHILDTFDILYPNGTTAEGVPINSPPPKSIMSLPFQGSMCYIPADDTIARRLYYSIPNTISAIGVEQVPAPYFLEFQTPSNDSITSIARSNGGRSLLVFFNNYTMLVNYLPQSVDAGVFDTRVREYVSSSRGAAGRLLAIEFTLPTGQTLIAAVDTLGLWVTDGIRTVAEWSRDLDWNTTIAGVDLSTAELVDNIQMRRLELLYLSGSARKELHFYYGRLKQDGDGNEAPLITGPHAAGVRTKHYANVAGTWIGWSGSAAATGGVFIERVGTRDDALGYDANGNIPWVVEGGDMYVAGLGNDVVVEHGYPKFGSDGTRAVTVIGTFKRDGALAAVQHAKTFTTTADKVVYWHVIADRHKIRFEDISSSALPPLVAYEMEVRTLGRAQD